MLTDRYYRTAETFAYIRPNLPIKKTVTDNTCGITTEEIYTYDDHLRTLKPRSITNTESYGADLTRVYRYPFDLTDYAAQYMTSINMRDKSVTESMYKGTVHISTDSISYARSGDWCYPAKRFSRIGNGKRFIMKREDGDVL